MTINRRKKNSRQRGSHTHGWGAMKKHRGAGNRGGKGLAGSGKRADSKKPSLWNSEWFGKRGFASKSRKRSEAINLRTLAQRLPQLLKDNAAKEEAGIYAIDLPSIGIDKLIGGGKAKKKFKITVPAASRRSKETVEKAGGQVITT